MPQERLQGLLTEARVYEPFMPEPLRPGRGSWAAAVEALAHALPLKQVDLIAARQCLRSA